jgi:hypothetical protein
MTEISLFRVGGSDERLLDCSKRATRIGEFHQRQRHTSFALLIARSRNDFSDRLVFGGADLPWTGKLYSETARLSEPFGHGLRAFMGKPEPAPTLGRQSSSGTFV